MKHDTPRTDAAKPYWDSAERENCVSIEFSRWLERELTASLENQYRAQSEVAKLNHQLLKTESDLLQSQDISFFLSGEFDIANARAKKAEAEVDRLTGLLRSLRKLPSSDWYREHNIPLQ